MKNGGLESSGEGLRQRLQALSPAERARLKRRVSEERMTGAALVAEGLFRCGIQAVMGITGTPVDQVFTECARRGIRVIGTRHQQAAVMMAAAANYIAGWNVTAVIVSAGPGVTNTLTGVLVARDNGWPVIVIGGRRPIDREGIGYFQELDAVPVFSPVTKWAARIDSADGIMAALIKAYKIARDGRPGPVYIDVPEDVLGGMALVMDSPGPGPRVSMEAEPRQVAEALRLIQSACRPLMILGEEVRWSFTPGDLERVLNEFGIPFVTSPMGRGFIPDDHPLCVNDVRHWIQSQADTVLMVGAWFDWRFRFGAGLASRTKIIHVDINPETLGRNVAAALLIHADSGRFLSQLTALSRCIPALAQMSELRSWRKIVQGACGENRRNRFDRIGGDVKSNFFVKLYRAVQDILPEKSVVVLDGGINLAMGQALLSAKGQCFWLDPGLNGCMGTGVPFGLGAKLLSPDRVVIVVCGDFSFGLGVMEMETAVRHKIPIIVVIANNSGINGALRQKRCFSTEYPERFCEFLPDIRYDLMVKAFGCHTEQVENVEEIGPALARAAASGLPACVNVRMDPETPHPGAW